MERARRAEMLKLVGFFRCRCGKLHMAHHGMFLESMKCPRCNRSFREMLFEEMNYGTLVPNRIP